MALITHFTKAQYWLRALREDAYRADSLEHQGFIHCSTPEQVASVANTVASSEEELLLLWIDEEKVRPRIIYENLEGGERLFPHIYGPLNLDSVVQVSIFSKNDDGEYEQPRRS